MYRKAAKALLLGTATSVVCAGAVAAQDKYQIYLSMSYIGNDWQSQSANMVSAMAASKTLRDKVDLEVQVAGTNAQKQIQQINAMVQAGADAIIVFPISPTALNPVVRNACNKGVKVFAYESEITEPCAHNVSIDNVQFGRDAAEWLVEELGGEGDVVYINGVPGVSADTDRTAGVMEVFDAHEGINVIATGVGMWSESVARAEMTKILASHSWDKIDGVLSQLGCFSIIELQLEAGIPQDALKPCSGEAGNGFLTMMLPEDTEVEGASGNYRPMGVNGFSTFAPASTGGYALKLAVEALEGKEFGHDILIEPRKVSPENVKLCQTGSWDEMHAGCNVFQPARVESPGFTPAVYNPDTPENGLNAALTGTPEE